MAERSYPASEVRGGWEELPQVRGQGWRPRRATPGPRSDAAAERIYPTSEVSGGWRRHPAPEARGGSWREPPTPEARAHSLEEQPEEQWLRRRRRA